MVRDSAGVRIVETVVAQGTAAPWTVSSEPILRIGWDERGPLFEDLVSGLILNGQRMVVADSGSRLIYVLGSSGEVLATLGGEGEGPQEFAQLTNVVHVAGDTILVQDAGNGRLSVYWDGSLLSQASFVSWTGSTLYRVLGRVHEGYALWPAGFMGHPPEPEPGWHHYPILRLDRGSMSLDTVAMVGLHLHPEPDDHNPVRPVGTVSVAGGEVVYGTTDRPELVWSSGGGKIRQIARWKASTEGVDEEDWAAYERNYRDRYADVYQPSELERRLVEQREDFSGPPPQFGRAFGDREGRIWLSAYQLGQDPTRARRFSVVAPDGRLLGAIEFPRSVRILDVAGDRVLTVDYDEFDVQAVAVYRLAPRVAQRDSGRQR